MLEAIERDYARYQRYKPEHQNLDSESDDELIMCANRHIGKHMFHRLDITNSHLANLFFT